MTITSFSRTGQVAYQELLRLHLDEAASEIKGSIEQRQRNGRIYLYDRYRLGTQVVSRYIGEGTPERLARLESAAKLKKAGEERRKAMSRLARTVRIEGFIATDRDTGSLLAAFARTGVFRLGGTIVGTAAYGLYQGELGVRFSADELARTGDIDFASFHRLSLALEDQVTEPTNDVLSGLKFDPVPSMEGRHVWKWRHTNGEGMVEFLTPAFGEETMKSLPTLGVSAQALNYLNYLIAEPIPAIALYRSGILVQIPRPERYAIHKLIVANRRRASPSALKAKKDRGQAAFLISVLANDRPDEIAQAYEDAMRGGPRWREHLNASLALLPETRETLQQLIAG